MRGWVWLFMALTTCCPRSTLRTARVWVAQLMKQKRKYGIVYAYPQKTPDLSKQSWFARIMVGSHRHSKNDCPGCVNAGHQ